MLTDRTLEGHILSIIESHEILEQNDLKKILQERGYEIPQATLSRRLKKLNIAKVSGVYKVINFGHAHLPLVLNMQISEFGLIILHTYPGHANSLAYFFDQKYVTYSSENSKKSGILGTIAGDDTVLLIIKSQKDLKNIVNLISQEFPYLKIS